MALDSIVFTAFKLATRPLLGKGLGKYKILANTYNKMTRAIIPAQKKIIKVGNSVLYVAVEKGKDIDGVSQKLIFNHEYEPMTTLIFQRFINLNSVVVDIGANIGYFTVLAADKALEGKVYAFEPERHNFDSLSSNILRNKFTNVHLSRMAVTEQSGVQKFYLNEKESGANSLVKTNRGERKTILVDVTKLDDVIKEKVDFIKSDTEGNEVGVLIGAKEVINRSDKLVMVIEYYPDGIIASDHPLTMFWDLLKEYGFKTYVVDDQQRFIKAGGQELADQCYAKTGYAVNILCVKGDIYGVER